MVTLLTLAPAPVTMLAPGTTLALFSMPGGWEWIIILVIGLLLFGKRLPEVGRSLGKGIVEFKKGIKGIEEEIETESTQRTAKAAPSQLEEQRTVARGPSGAGAEAFASPEKA